MSEGIEKRENIDIPENAEGGLSQEKFADLFSKLEESFLNEMMENAGLTDGGLPVPEDSGITADTEVPVEEPAETEPAVNEETVGEADPEKETINGTADGDKANTVLNASAGEGLGPEHIGHLLKVLGDDVIKDMLESAGLDDDDIDEIEKDDAKEDPGSEGSKKKPKARRKITLTRRFLFVAIFIGILLLVAAVNKIYMSASINSNDPIQYASHTDEISADQGSLHVNNVSVAVPSSGKEQYSISYSWSEEDDQYPSVPHAITAIYPNEEEDGGVLYSISLYRNESISSKEIKSSKKKADNWFSDWKTVTEGDILQAPLKSGDINGFYIYPNETEDGQSADYNDYSYYFTVKEDDGISIYVIEGVCADEEISAEFRTIMDNCIQNITIK